MQNDDSKKFFLYSFLGKKSKKSGRSRKTEETENEPEPEPEAPSKSSDKNPAGEKKKEFKFEFQIGGGKDPKKNPKKPKKGDDSGPLDDRGFYGDAASQVKFQNFGHRTKLVISSVFKLFSVAIDWFSGSDCRSFCL